MLAQDPPAHAQDIAQPTVNLLVAAPDDEAPDGFVMPDLVGLPVVSAQSTLAKVGIKSAAPHYVEVYRWTDRNRKCSAGAAGEAGRGDGAKPVAGSARGSDHDRQVDRGKVRNQSVAGRCGSNGIERRS